MRKMRTRKTAAAEMLTSAHAAEVHAAGMHPSAHAAAMHAATTATGERR